MTDPDDNPKLQYIKSDLLPVNFNQRWKATGTGADDDDSNNLFMSEPSISEAEEFSDHRLLSPLGSFTEDEDRRDGLPPPPPPPARLLVTPLAPASPGNTSLSSWESPHWNQQQRIHLHFSPGGDSFSHQADSSVQSNPHHLYYRTSPYLSTSNPMLNIPSDPYLASGLIPPSTDAKTPERSHVPSSNSTSPASEGQRRVLEAFLDDLRVNSQGQVQQTTGTNISFGSSTYQGLLNASDAVPDRTRSSLQSRKNQSQETRTSNVELTGRQSSSNDNIGSTTKNARTDESVIMYFSDDSGDETKHTVEETRPLDWEEKMSADDEKTTEKRASRNIRTARSHGSGGGRNGQTTSGRGHFRQRSGDAAAATLSTGSKEWKGMEQDKIPLPPVPGGHDDDDDDDDEDEQKLIKPTNSNNRGKDSKDVRTLNGSNRKKSRPIDATIKPDIAQNKETVAPSEPLHSQNILGSSDFAHFTIGRVEKESVTSHRRPAWIRQRREMYRGRKSAGPMLESEDSSSLASADPLPNGVQRVRHASLPSTAFSGYMPSPDLSLHESHQLRKGNHPVPWSPQSITSSSEQGIPNFDFADWQHFTGSFQDYPTHPVHIPVRSNSLEFGPGFQSHRVADIHAWGHNSTGSIQSAFSWISDRNREALGTKSLLSRSEMSPLIEGGIKTYSAETLQEFNPTSDSISPSNDLEPQQTTKRRSLILSPLMEGGRKAFQDSPFSNIGKRFAKADRQRFLPTAGFDNDDEKYPTFVCPVCKTRQREFFTVTSAPRQFESASGYIALYFGIYVIAALYIFGLEEGWGKLDCIYFAVITLTTAGLGDFVPTSDGAKVVCSIFIYFGVACIGLLLGSYIAGMLDESSRRAAHANRIKSCPNCVRIQNIREAAERRRNQYKERRHDHEGYDMTPLMADDCDHVDRTAKRLKRQHHRVNLEDQVRQFSSERPSKEIHHQVMSPESKRLSVDFGADTRSWSLSGRTVSKESQLNDIIPPSHHSSHAPTQQSQSTWNMFRKMHSRHFSLDLNGSNAGVGIQSTPPRKYSADLVIPVSIGEQSAQSQTVENPPLRPRWNDDNSGSETSEDDSDEFSSTSAATESASSSEESSLNLEDQYNGVKNARYVFLTLREALVNSLVIIGTGCFGFYFIEGFSFIDSWYFTTVLLTTVGYGDLVPYTKGGKLFATIYILVAGTILLNNMSMISMIPLELRRRRIEKAVLTQFGDSLDDSALRELATGPLIRRLNLATDHVGGLDECTREMFCLAMLVRLGKVTEEDIKLTFAAFKKLDVHDEKVLNSRAIIAGMIQKRRANLELNKANCSHTMSNRSNRSMASYGSLHSTSFTRNSSAPSPIPSNMGCDTPEEATET